MVEAAASAIAVEAYKDGRSIFGYVTQKIDYADDFNVNFEKMTEQARMLYARRDDVEAELNKNKMKRATKECEGWIYRVKVAEQEVLKLESKYKKEIRHAWRFPRFWPRANLSKHMAKKREELKVLLEEGKLDNGVVVERPPDPVRVIYAPSTENKPSLHWAVEEILGNLRERNVKRIGLWGMVGTGKTTVMQNLNNTEEVKKMFDIVIWVSVSQAWSIEKVQDSIMQRLKLKVEAGVTAIETAQLISNELGGMRYLLLLDEVWDPFDLHEIGIPNNNKDSKVVFASRFRDLCYDMDADELVNMKRLSYGDAYKMFEEKVGRTMKNPSIIPIAQLVVRECAGLPLLIDKVAKVFRKKDNIHLWRDGLRSLQRWPSIKIQGMDEVLEFLKFCYNDLDGEDKKVCFLYGALFPEDCDIFVDYLMECWKAEGFLLSIDEFRDARDRGHNILHDLINVSLLERSATKRHVRMNKVLRNMALKISSGGPDYKLLARTCEGLKEAPKEEEWTSANRISLMDNDLCILPVVSNCTNLSTLLLQRNYNLMMIPDGFFLSMQRLRVLDLHELPSSLEALVHLEVLDIRRTGILSLPIQVGCLMQMKCLRMSLSNFGTGIPMSKVISSISSLEELIIDVDPTTLWSDQVVKTITEEVSTLTRLTSLTFSFPKVECLEIFVKSSPLWKDLRFTFQFSVGICTSVKYHILDYFEYQLCKCLKYANDEGVHPVISEVLTETDVFELIDHKNISSLSDFGTVNMSKLRACSVEGCEDIICIIDGNVAPPPAFEWLERMVIKSAPSLHCIWNGPGPVPVGSLGQMTSLSFYNCPKLKKIFSNGLIEQLSKLQHLSVEECYEIEEIVIETENPRLDSRTLPSLKILVLHDLPKLRSITPDDTLIWPSLERLDIASCPSLLKLPFSGENAISLRSIDAEQSWWSTLVWQDDAIEKRLRSLCNFT
ncbi:disease resistance protein RPS2-like isoform X2 [Rhodamnia argentea]|uniref:Disease resistance protein RPS2-like isoform X2 n=1 Tax=Rhodamnia argentea TaxID=178133 RepID=A0ABM3HEX8_9MYRT|nr:disease resistance protein RPS2-like isoform X2 [Rhodamnia argentea]